MITSLQLIKHFEGFREQAYQDSAGVWTVGYGFTVSALPGVAQGFSMKQPAAYAFLIECVAAKEAAVRGLAMNLAPHQLAALTCLAYNIGTPALERSTLMQYVRQGNNLGAASIWTQWDHAGGGAQAGLLKRRLVEAAVYLGEGFEFMNDAPSAREEV